MHEAFTRATQLEWAFWDAAYRLETWPSPETLPNRPQSPLAVGNTTHTGKPNEAAQRDPALVSSDSDGGWVRRPSCSLLARSIWLCRADWNQENRLPRLFRDLDVSRSGILESFVPANNDRATLSAPVRLPRTWVKQRPPHRS